MCLHDEFLCHLILHLHGIEYDLYPLVFGSAAQNNRRCGICGQIARFDFHARVIDKPDAGEVIPHSLSPALGKNEIVFLYPGIRITADDSDLGRRVLGEPLANEIEDVVVPVQCGCQPLVIEGLGLGRVRKKEIVFWKLALAGLKKDRAHQGGTPYHGKDVKIQFSEPHGQCASGRLKDPV